jgi:hypothetical protein
MGKFTGLTGITYSGDDAKTVLLDDVFNDVELNAILTVVDGVVAKQRLAYIDNLDLIVKADSGCGHTTGLTKAFTDRQKEWNPVNLEAWLTLCEADFRATIARYASKAGNLVITNPVAEAIALELLRDAIKKDVLRQLWFNHKSAAAYTAGGILLNADIVSDYNTYNGFFEQIIDAVDDGLIPNEKITANDGATTDLQKVLTAGTALTLFTNMVQNADDRLHQATDLVIMSTSGLFYNYKNSLTTSTLESSKRELTGGFETVMFDGIPVINMNIWSRYINAHFRKDASSLFRPHRAVLCSKSELLAGFCASSAPNAIEMWVDKSEKYQQLRALYQNDALIGREYMFSVAGLEAIS